MTAEEEDDENDNGKDDDGADDEEDPEDPSKKVAIESTETNSASAFGTSTWIVEF